MLKKLWQRIVDRLKKGTPKSVVAEPIVASPIPVTEPVVVAPAPAPVKEPTFVDNFSKLDLTKWTVSTWSAPGSSPTHKGTFLAKNVSIVEGTLRLALTQVATAAGVTSKGAEIATKDSFHYGTFEWEARASSTAATPSAVGSPVSGSITGLFVYFDSAQTEIDFEVEGNERHKYVQLTSWVGESNPNSHTKVDSGSELPHNAFHRYKFIWYPGRIEFYRNEILIGTHTQVVPTLPAKVMINHWGTDNANWGGMATVGVERYLYVKNFKYTPL